MMKRIALVTVACLVASLAQAGQGAANAHAQGKGQGKGQAQGQAQDQYQGQYDDRDYGNDAKGHGKDNQGQVTSDCNQQANQRKLKGQERKQYVEWCQDRGSSYKYDDKRWSNERSCYQKADDKGLAGDKRKKYLRECFEKGSWTGIADQYGKGDKKGDKR